MANNLKVLISKLNPVCRKAAERAAALCMSQGHYEVDLEHLLLALCETEDSDFAVLCRKAGISLTELERDLGNELKSFQNGNTRTPVFSPHLPALLEHAWLLASLEAGTAQIRSGHLLIALLTSPELSQLAHRSSRLFTRLPIDEIKHKLDTLAAGSQETVLRVEAASDSPADAAELAAQSQGMARTPALDQFTTDLTQRAREGKIDPVIGRDSEIRQAIDILMRRRQNNPILTGEAGVGKTAVVEGLALRIAKGDVPPPLTGVAVRTLDMGLLQAGASVKGEFENRLKNVIDEVRKSLVPIILFIDEAHTMIGAGGQAGQNDAANLLKPALARGELRTIAATTWSEYKKYFEKDAALARRFQVIKVEEPSEELASAMLRAMSPLMEKHFNVRILDEAISDAVRLSARYISGRQLPDKAISVLDTACARVALAQSATPARIEDATQKLLRVEAEITSLARERASGRAHDARIEELNTAASQLKAEIAADTQRWDQERELVRQIGALRAELEHQASSTPAEALASAAARKGKGLPASPAHQELERLSAELHALQGDAPLVSPQVDANVVAEIISGWTGIPLGKMVKDEIQAVIKLHEALEARVIGQSHAIEAVCQRVRTARANLEDPNKPKGVFLFVGPSGVGKTETALALAEALYGGERNLITINMSEYQEAHTVSGLKGSPPGYVGYGEGGVLTEAVRRKPHSVVLLDEVEKAHPDVLELFFQVFDKGVLDDAEGREIDFRNTLIILTSNVGSSTVMQACLNKPEAELPSPDELDALIRGQLNKAFKPAFLGRLKVVPFYPISDEILLRIIRLKLERIAQRIAENHSAVLSYSEELVEAVLERCTEVDSGARNVDNILNGSLLPEIAGSVLARMAEGRAIRKIKLSTKEDGSFKFAIS